MTIATRMRVEVILRYWMTEDCALCYCGLLFPPRWSGMRYSLVCQRCWWQSGVCARGMVSAEVSGTTTIVVLVVGSEAFAVGVCFRAIPLSAGCRRSVGTGLVDGVLSDNVLINKNLLIMRLSRDGW